MMQREDGQREVGELARTFNPGDSITRTTPTGQETVVLPPIASGHLRQLVVAGVGGAILGFHILPASAAVSSASPVILAAGTVTVADRWGTVIPGAQVRLIPRKVPRSSDDTLEARVEVIDTAGTVIVSAAHKTFFPQSWTEGQIQQAVYAALVEAYTARGAALGRLIGVTEQGVKIELRVQGAISAAGTHLTAIATAMPQPGQILGGPHRP